MQLTVEESRRKLKRARTKSLAKDILTRSRKPQGIKPLTRILYEDGPNTAFAAISAVANARRRYLQREEAVRQAEAIAGKAKGNGRGGSDSPTAGSTAKSPTAAKARQLNGNNNSNSGRTSAAAKKPPLLPAKPQEGSDDSGILRGSQESESVREAIAAVSRGALPYSTIDVIRLVAAWVLRTSMFVVSDPAALFHLFYCFVSLMGYFISPFFFSVHLLDIVYREDTLRVGGWL